MSAKLCRLMSTLELFTSNNKGQNLTGFIQKRFKWVGYRKYYKDRPYIRKRIVANPDELKTYTFEPLKTLRTGGRDSTGRVWTNRIGGGDKHDWLMVDHKRPAEKDGPSVVERVMEIVVDPHRTSRLAVVAHGETKRRITATENMKVGDIIKTTNHIPTIAVVAVEGNSHPLGALPPGTIVNSVEEYAGHGGIFARAAGAGAQVVKQVGGKSYIKLPSGHEIVLPQSCMATVGRTWKPEEFIKMRKAGEIRWKGIRPRGGLFQKKTGYHGRKIRKPKSFVRDENPPPPRFTKKKFIME